jgi:hypothetical protein
MEGLIGFEDYYLSRKSNNSSRRYYPVLILKHRFEKFHENRKTLLEE